jgi:hypothetical protein
MTVSALRIGLAAACVGLVACKRPGPPGGPWGFEADPPGRPPGGFTFTTPAEGRRGIWVVRRIPDAAGGTAVLVQHDTDPAKRRWLAAVAPGPALADVSARVRCKPVAGLMDQSCGLVIRFADERHYYVARADSLDGNVRLYAVTGDRRAQLASATVRVDKGVWHELRVDARGDRFVVFLDGRAVIDAHDHTFSAPGRVGVWTKSDALTYFDELSARPVSAEGPFPLP